MSGKAIFYIMTIGLLIIFISSWLIPDPEPVVIQKGSEVIFTEWYNVNRYHIAGTENYQYVIDFIFESEEEATAFIQKIEQLRITGEGYDFNKRDDRADKNEG